MQKLQTILSREPDILRRSDLPLLHGSILSLGQIFSYPMAHWPEAAEAKRTFILQCFQFMKAIPPFIAIQEAVISALSNFSLDGTGLLDFEKEYTAILMGILSDSQVDPKV